MNTGDQAPHELTGLFDAIEGGDPNAANQLFEMVYGQLRALAHGRIFREAPNQTLQTTDLVNEAYLRLCKGSEFSWENRRHFFGAAVNAMRQILVDRGRKKKAEIHGGNLQRVELDGELPDRERSMDILALDEALTKLAETRPRHVQVVTHRYFLGLSVKDTAEILGIAPRTVDADWKFAKAWLRRAISPTSGSSSGAEPHGG